MKYKQLNRNNDVYNYDWLWAIKSRVYSNLIINK